MISSIISRLVILICGTLYPAYASYKAVRTKNLKEYVKWMMYWIVFAIFTFVETITDVFLSWFPFYYEVKIVLVIWLLSPATKGSSILYRKFVHPELCKREQGIDEYIAKAKDHGYHTVLNLGTRGVNYATTVIMQTAIKGGGGLVQQLRKSYSLSDLTECDPRDERSHDEADDVLTEPRVVVRRAIKNAYTTRRSASESNSRSPMYFPEVDVDLRSARSSRSDEPDFSHIKSSEDISSGYSSADNSTSLTRTSSLGPGGRVKRPGRTTVTTIKRPQAAEGNEVIIEELHDDESVYTNMPPLINLPSPLLVSNTNPPFVYQCVGDEIRIVQVLGQLPFDTNLIENNSSDQWDQLESNDKEITRQNTTKKDVVIEKFSEENVLNKTSDLITLAPEENVDNKNKLDITDNKNIPLSMEHENRESLNVETKADTIDDKTVVKEDKITDLDTTFNENNSAESDDEASFGTPEDSPKNKRKSPRGKYGKRKAPSPPKVDILELNSDISDDRKNIENLSTTSQESLVDFVNTLPNTSFKDTGFHKNLHVVNPIVEKKRRHKTKSPNRVPKANSSGIGKLLQLPSKLAFWHKSDVKNKSDNVSTSSGDFSRRSSTVDNSQNEFEDCNDFPVPPSSESHFITERSHLETPDDLLTFRDAADIENEVISQDIIEKSDALKKLIEAKLESHPEYKFIPLNEEIPTTSKSTDV